MQLALLMNEDAEAQSICKFTFVNNSVRTEAGLGLLSAHPAAIRLVLIAEAMHYLLLYF